jgi:hypothetical protein
MFAIGRAVAVVVFVMATGARPVAAQVVDAKACADMQQQVAYLLGEGDFVQQAGLKEGVDLLAGAKITRDAACGTVGDDTQPNDPSPGPPNPARSDPAPADAPVVVPPISPPPAADPDDGNPSTRKDACVLVTQAEVDAAMLQPSTANEGDPAGFPLAQGCQYTGQGEAYTNLMYIQANSAFYFNSFHDTAEANGVQVVSGLGDRAFSYVGSDGPGLVVAKGDKLFVIEFGGIGSGPPEKSRLLTLAGSAVGRVK